MEGYGALMKFHNTAIITLNEDSFPQVPADGAGYAGAYFKPATAQGGLSAVDSDTARATGDYRVDGLFRGLLLYPKTMHITKAPQWNPAPSVKEDSSTSWEKSLYGACVLNGVRIFDVGVRQIFFGRKGQALKTHS